MKHLTLILAGLAASGLLLLIPVAAQGDLGGLPPGPGAELVFAKCQSCHSLQYVTDSAGLPPFLWEDTVDMMISYGLQVTDEERATIVEYLSTYLGPDPPPPAEGGAAAEPTEGAGEQAGQGTEPAAAVSGEAVYSANCVGCHQADGQGLARTFPPLAGLAPTLYGAEGGRAYLAKVLLYGLRGPIQVEGVSYNGVMPGWSHLRDADIAAVLNHVLTAWGNEGRLPEGFTPYTPEDIAAQRGTELNPQQVHAMRPELSGGE